MDGADQRPGAGRLEKGNIVMSRQNDLMRACDAMRPQKREEFLKMIWSQKMECYDLPGIQLIWNEASRDTALKCLSMFQYGVIIGKRM